MPVTLLDQVRFAADMPSLVTKLRIKDGSKHLDSFQALAAEAVEIGRPRAMYREAYVESKEDGAVVVDGVRFQSRVMRVNLEQAYRVFPYVATCGVELAAWYRAQDDLLQQFWAETIAEVALRQALTALRAHLKEQYRPKNLSAMAPGSLEDWPLQEQKPLFALLGDPEGAVGVRLTESMLMVPTKSVSGIFFPSEASFESCQLCPRAKCPGRRAPYDEGLRTDKYGLARPETS
jgi:hypothetical protein